MSKDFDPSLRGRSEVPQSGRKILNGIQALRDRRDWPEIEADIFGRGLEALCKLLPSAEVPKSPEEVLRSPLNGFISSPGDPDFDHFCEYTGLGARRPDQR